MLNIIGIENFSHVKKTNLLDYAFIYSNLIEELVDISLLFEWTRCSILERIFPIKKNIKYYKIFIKKPSK